MFRKVSRLLLYPWPLAIATALTLGCVGDRSAQQATAPTESGITIVGVTVYDGTGAPPFTADVRVVEDRIAAVGQLTPAAGDTVVEADGLALAPGFIDTHSHADADILALPEARAAISQGITTVVGGPDGGSQSPLTDFFQRFEEAPATVNLASFGGHNSYRETVMGEDFRRAATTAEIDAMRALLEADLAAGALGLSTGLEYDPGIFSTPEEVIALAQVAADAGGRYTSHLRSEDRTFWEAVDEILEIGRETGLPVNITHMKLALRSNQGRASELLARLDQARAAGIDVTADVYPYTYWQSTLTVLFPKRDFDNLESARFAVTEVTTPEGMLIPYFAPEPELAGKTLAAIAAARGADPAVTLMELIRSSQEFQARTGADDVESVIGVSMSETDVEQLLAWPFTNVCTDGELDGSHPRGYGSFPRVLGMYVRERGILSPAAAIHRMTERAALSAGLLDRGRIKAGHFADLVLLDPETVSDRATTDDPQAVSEGIVKVWVNGQLVWDNGAVTQARPGRVLRRSTS